MNRHERTRLQFENPLTKLLFDWLNGKVELSHSEHHDSGEDLKRALVVKVLEKNGEWANNLADELEPALKQLFDEWTLLQLHSLSEAILVADGWWTYGDDWADEPAPQQLLTRYEQAPRLNYIVPTK